MRTGTKIAVGVGIAAVVAIIYKMRKGKATLPPTGNQQPATQQPATALPAQQAPTIKLPEPVYIYNQELRDRRGGIGVDESYRNQALAGLSYLLR